MLWRVARTIPPPKLIIGQLEPGAPMTLKDEQQFDLQQAAGFPEKEKGTGYFNLAGRPLGGAWMQGPVLPEGD